MKILITGGAGFIGSNLVSYFNQLDEGYEIVVFDDRITGRAESIRRHKFGLAVRRVSRLTNFKNIR